MTRKDYILIAEVIATSWHANAEAKRDLAVSMAEALETDNPRFDSERFLRACGVGYDFTSRMFTPQGELLN
jgi:hypothetical protein